MESSSNDAIFEDSSGSNGASEKGLNDTIISTNNEIDTHYRSLAEQEASIFERERRLKILIENITKRQATLGDYTDDLSKTNQLLQLSKRQFSQEYAETDAKIDKETEIMSKTLSNLHSESALNIEKRMNLEKQLSVVKDKLTKLEQMEEVLKGKRSALKQKISGCDAAAPKRTPDKLQKEIQLLNQNILAASQQISKIKASAVDLDIKAVSYKSQRSRVTQTGHEIRDAKVQEVANFNAQMAVIKAELDSKIQLLAKSDAKNMEMKTLIARKQRKVEDWKSSNRTKLDRIKRLIGKIETMKDEVDAKKRDTDDSRELCERMHETTKQLSVKRAVFEREKNTEYLTMKSQNKSLQHKLGQMLYYLTETHNELSSSEKTIEHLDASLEMECNREQELNALENEINTMGENNETELINTCVQKLDELQRKIAFAEQEERDIRYSSLQLVRPLPISTPSLHSNEKKLKKKLMKERNDIENIQFEVSTAEAQLESKKKELLLVKANMEHSEVIYRKLRRENIPIMGDAGLERELAKRRKQQENFDLIVKLEQKQHKLLARRRDLQMKAKHLDSVSRNSRLQYFGENVSIVVHPYEEEEFSHSRKRYVDANRFLALEKLENMMRKTQLEVKLWKEYVKPTTCYSQLESWNEQLPGFESK